MLDLETLATSADAVVLTVGCVKFDPFVKEAPQNDLYLKINLDEQTEKNRTINNDTLNWWSKQPQAAKDEAFAEEGRISMEEVAVQLNRYLVGVNKIWAQGPLFDIVILENFYKMLDKPVPWSYWQIRDSRTVFDMGDSSAKTSNKDAHNALSDARAQAIAVQTIYKQLGVKKA